MAEEGHLVLARKFFDSWSWSLTGNQIKVFLWLLYRARWSRSIDRWWDGDEMVEIGRGELLSQPPP